MTPADIRKRADDLKILRGYVVVAESSFAKDIELLSALADVVEAIGYRQGEAGKDEGLRIAAALARVEALVP